MFGLRQAFGAVSQEYARFVNEVASIVLFVGHIVPNWFVLSGLSENLFHIVY